MDIHAGSAVNGAVYHFGDPSVATGTLAATPLKVGQPGASISGLSLLAADDVRAGNGGFGAAGGGVSNLILQSDTAALNIFSGNGGSGNATIKAGPGGDIAGITIKGVVEATPNQAILIQAGDGGPDSAFKGGGGGSISGVATSFDLFNPMTEVSQVSSVFLEDNIILHAGDGGMGLKGGSGGSISNSLLYGSIPDDDVINAGGTANPEIAVLAGQGGAAASATAGHGGNGGAISQITAENVDPDAAAATSSIFIHSGDAGAGRNAGNINGITLLGTYLTVDGGNGGAGSSSAGNGASLNTISILNNTQIFATNITLDAGVGGTAGNGAGGSGGNITTLTVGDSNIASLVINGGTHANGGAGGGGVGGDGGSLSGVQINDSGPFLPNAATVAIRSGTGGDGLLGGGAGGDIGTSAGIFQLLGTDFAYNVSAGAGGNVPANGTGRGGAGGTLDNIGISNQSLNDSDMNYSAGANGTVASGAGGNGTRGGNGGDVVSVDLRTTFDATLTAGNGGLGTTSKAGAGGGIATSASSSLLGASSVAAGNAGTSGARHADGGTINTFIAAALTNISMTAGNGTFGGAGGSILNSGTTFDELTQEANDGSVIVTAGNGSSANGVGGAGGSINIFNGSIGQSGSTAITAGSGGGGANRTAAEPAVRSLR